MTSEQRPDRVDRHAANQAAFEQIVAADPVVLDIAPAIEAVPGMKKNMVLTAGAPLGASGLIARQRAAVIGGALYEGLASDAEDVEAKLASGEIEIGSTHEHGCAGPHAGIFTASTPVFVVEDRNTGKRGYCSIFEGDSTPKRLCLGFYDDDVIGALKFVDEVVAPTLKEAIRISGGIEISELIRLAIELGDDGHVRSVAGTLLFTRALLPSLFELAKTHEDAVRQTVSFLESASFTFLRPWMAADKAIVDGLRGFPGSSIVTVMSLSCKEFAIQVSGLGGTWFRGPHPSYFGTVLGELIEPGVKPPEGWGWWFGADSMITECLGFGGFSGAAAFALQERYLKGSTSEHMVARSRAMYDITVGEHPRYTIPFFGHRGVPVGIDIFKVLETGTLPTIHGGVSKKDGSAGAGGVVFPPMACFEAAAAAYRERYGSE